VDFNVNLCFKFFDIDMLQYLETGLAGKQKHGRPISLFAQEARNMPRDRFCRIGKFVVNDNAHIFDTITRLIDFADYGDAWVKNTQ
jgi:hypothetical protein